MYGDPHHRQTRAIWNQITTFVCENLDKPVVCFGDLNNINRLFDLDYSGPAYTWTNKRFSSSPVFERLDRCLANAEWCTIFPNTNVFNLPIILGDHAPILVSTESQFRKL